MVTERFFEQRSEMTALLSAQIAQRVTEGVEARGQASLVATGGSTPAPLYDLLCKAEAPWDKTTITLSDERWVDVQDAGSNERLVRQRLLQGRAASARLVGLKTGDASPAQAVDGLNQALGAIHRPFDVVVLGMGGDAHMASLFPKAPELAAAFDTGRPDLVCAVNRPGADGSPERISLTLRALLDARWIAILIEGAAKRETYQRIADADMFDAPVRAILKQQNVPVEIWWAP